MKVFFKIKKEVEELLIRKEIFEKVFDIFSFLILLIVGH
jgi:hypothetical protein